jgi:ribonuclease D
MEVRILTSSSDDIGEAICVLAAASVLALDCEGVNLGRCGQLCIIQIATQEVCFLFDVLELSASCELAVSLKTILEDENIVKVIHDCKMDSDALFHKLDINLAGVHDTQVWDKVLKGSETNLNQTLLTYDCTPNEERSSDVYKINNHFWATRPLTHKMVEWASGDVANLFELHEKQREQASADQREEALSNSEAKSRQLRECVVFKTRIKAKNMGRFIGPKGKNLRDLMGQVPGIFFHIISNDGSGCINIYGPDEASVARAEGLLARFQ